MNLTRLISWLFPRRREILSLRSEISVLQANLDGTILRLREAEARNKLLEESHLREVDTLRHQVDWFAVQTPYRQQVFGTLPESSLPKRPQVPEDGPAVNRVSARQLALQQTLEFLQKAQKMRSEYYSDREGETPDAA